MSETSVRTLANLEQKASDGRILNLRKSALDHADDPDLQARRFFRNAGLNRAIIIKHHLRPNEVRDFDHPPALATKVILPISHDSLRSGAKAFFVGQADYATLVRQEFGFSDPEELDLQVLNWLDQTISLDAFLLPDHLRLRGWEPAAAYFDTADRAMADVLSFAEAEIAPLLEVGVGLPTVQSRTFARKLLSRADANELAGLRQALQLSGAEFASGILGWKTVIHGKFRLVGLAEGMRRLRLGLDTLATAKRGRIEDHQALEGCRVALRRILSRASGELSAVLGSYDGAYNRLMYKGQGGSLRAILCQAPAWSQRLSLILALIEHMVSFWSANFPTATTASLSVDAVATRLRSFEDGVRPSANILFKM